jgi:GGDEF domain-containing protein
MPKPEQQPGGHPDRRVIPEQYPIARETIGRHRQQIRELARDTEDAITEKGEQISSGAINRVARKIHRTLVENELDPLTGLPNRAIFDRKIEDEIARTARTQQPFSVAVLDVNGLKKVNDTYGHEAGDKFIKATAEALRGPVRKKGKDRKKLSAEKKDTDQKKGAVRKSDFVARGGHHGDEFWVVLRDTNEEAAELWMQRAHEHFKEAGIEKPGSSDPNDKIPITASIGVAEVFPGQDTELSDVSTAILGTADKRMYAAKSELKHIHPVTELPYKEAYDARLVVEIERAVITQQSFSVAKVFLGDWNSTDVDFSYRTALNERLQIDAATLLKGVRQKKDFIAHLSGRIFTVLLPQTNQENLQEWINRVMQQFTQRDLPVIISGREVLPGTDEEETAGNHKKANNSVDNQILQAEKKYRPRNEDNYPTDPLTKFPNASFYSSEIDDAITKSRKKNSLSMLKIEIKKGRRHASSKVKREREKQIAETANFLRDLAEKIGMSIYRFDIGFYIHLPTKSQIALLEGEQQVNKTFIKNNMIISTMSGWCPPEKRKYVIDFLYRDYDKM